MKKLITFLVASVLVASHSNAQSIAILNPNFDNVTLADGTTSSVANWLVAGHGGASNPPSSIAVPTSGENLAYSNGGTIYQTLTTTLAQNTVYTLTVDVIARVDSTPFGGYSIRLLAGTSTLLAQTTSAAGGPIPPQGGWRSPQVVFDSATLAPTDAAFGQNLKIELVSTGTQTSFDTVRLVIPEPSTALLGAFGALALLRRRRA